MSIKIGDTLPEVTFDIPNDAGKEAKTVDELFAGKKVVLFGVPGAFTPTCHRNHLPSYVENYDALKAKGIDAIYVTSVNDGFVMGAWADSTGAKGKIEFLADGNGDFAKAVGMELDASGARLGLRSHRYAMIVENKVVKLLNLESNPGEAGTSKAEAILEAL
jgi:peroxiredoxin